MFNAEKERDNVIAWIQNKILSINPKAKCVIGISGGKDSTVVAELCVRAIGKDRVIGVLLPNGIQNDISYSFEVVERLGIEYHVLNIDSIMKEIKTSISYSMKWLEDAKINTPARVRMTMLYAIAQCQPEGAFVINTCNLSEDYIGYSTWHGDSAGDFSPLANFTSDEVIAIGDACGIPHYLTHKVPSDGLCGLTDEDKLGFTYETLNKYIREGICEDKQIKKKIDNLHIKNEFKLKPLDSYKPIF